MRAALLRIAAMLGALLRRLGRGVGIARGAAAHGPTTRDRAMAYWRERAALAGEWLSFTAPSVRPAYAAPRPDATRPRIRSKPSRPDAPHRVTARTPPPRIDRSAAPAPVPIGPSPTGASPVGRRSTPTMPPGTLTDTPVLARQEPQDGMPHSAPAADAVSDDRGVPPAAGPPAAAMEAPLEPPQSGTRDATAERWTAATRETVVVGAPPQGPAVAVHAPLWPDLPPRSAPAAPQPVADLTSVAGGPQWNA